MPKLNLVHAYDIQEASGVDGRYYRTPDGKEYPSVTTILGRQPKPQLDAWFKKLGDEAHRLVRQSSVAGRSLHSQCESWLLNEPLPAALQAHRWLFRDMMPLLNNISAVYGVELALWSDRLQVAGRTDCVGVYSGVPSIVDFKNSRKPKERKYLDGYFMQSTMYAMMFSELYRIPIQQIVVLVSLWGGGNQEFIEPAANWVDRVIELQMAHNELWSIERQ